MNMTIVVLLFLMLTSCDSGTQWSDGSYSVYWIDTRENRQLGYDIGDGSAIGRVEGEVIGVGANSKYVVARRINHSNGNIEYFYIEKSKDHKFKNWNEISVGPLTEVEINEKTSELMLPKISMEFN